MKYRRILKSFILEYGRGKKFQTKNTALEEAKKIKKELLDEMNSKDENMKADMQILETDETVGLLCYIFVPLNDVN